MIASVVLTGHRALSQDFGQEFPFLEMASSPRAFESPRRPARVSPQTRPWGARLLRGSAICSTDLHLWLDHGQQTNQQKQSHRP